MQDEMLTLEMELNGVVRKKEEVERENRELVRRWMERMGVEAERANVEGGFT